MMFLAEPNWAVCAMLWSFLSALNSGGLNTMANSKMKYKSKRSANPLHARRK